MYPPARLAWLLYCNQTLNRVNSHFLPHDAVHVTSCVKIRKHSLSLFTGVKFLEWKDAFRLCACTLGVRRGFEWKARGSPFCNSVIPQEARLTSFFLVIITIHIAVTVIVVVITIVIVQFPLIFPGAYQPCCWPHHSARRRFEKWWVHCITTLGLFAPYRDFLAHSLTKLWQLRRIVANILAAKELVPSWIFHLVFCNDLCRFLVLLSSSRWTIYI